MRETKVQSSVIRRTGDGNAAVEVVIVDEADEADQTFFLHVRVSLTDLDKTPMRAIVARALAEAAKTATAEIVKLKPKRKPTVEPVKDMLLSGAGGRRLKRVKRVVSGRFGL